MSSISSLNADSGTLSLVDLLNEAQNKSSSVLSGSTTLASSNALLESMQSKKAQSAYGTGITSTLGQQALKRALSEIGSDGKVTFKDINEHREKLEAEFSATVRSDLAKLGVSTDTDFTLTMSSDGKIKVECDDAVAKEKIEKYLSDNPKACEQFGYIQALSNLERARQSGVTSWSGMQDAKKEIQAQAVEAFFGDAMNAGMNYASILADFGASTGISSSTASFYAGIDFTV